MRLKSIWFPCNVCNETGIVWELNEKQEISKSEISEIEGIREKK